MIALSYFSVMLTGFFLHKRNQLFTLLIFILLFFVSYGVVDRDFINYQNAYEWIKHNDYSDLGVGWFLLCKLGNFLGLDYGLFKNVIQIISLAILYKGITLFLPSKTPTPFFWSCVLIFPCFLDLLQVRFFLAESILFLGFYYLAKNTRSGRIIYIAILILASSIHSSVLFYMLFLILPFMKKYRKIWSIIITSSICVLYIFSQYAVGFFSNFVNERRIDRYFHSSDKTSFFGIIAAIVTLYVFHFLSKKMYEARNDENPLWQFLYHANKCMWLILPIMLFDPNIFRIQRPLWYFLYAGAILYFTSHKTPYIKIGKQTSVHLKQVIVFLAIFGNFAFISLYSFDIISSYLVH